jgi:hypothetical protein
MAAARIEVTAIDRDTFRVVVSEGGGQTTHTVTVDPADYQRISGGAVSADELVRRSFEFLLEHEPKESILRSFSLSVIARYFPDYEREIGRRLRRV